MCLIQRWPTRGPRAACGPKRNFCGPISNWESAIFRNVGCIYSVLWCIAAQKVNILGKISIMRPKNQFGLATPGLIWYFYLTFKNRLISSILTLFVFFYSGFCAIICCDKKWNNPVVFLLFFYFILIFNFDWFKF